MANEDQAAFWTETGGPVWLANEENLDVSSRPFGLATMEAANVTAGERIADIGCGTGTTAVELARRVGSDGHVLGLDISPLLLGRARERAEQERLTNVSFVEGDAQTYRFDPQHDLAFSRFGVMFFADPEAAFTNIRGALKSGGRLAFACWQDVFANLWMSLPTIAASSVLGAFDLPPEGSPGPFAFADRDRVRRILETAGFADVNVDGFETTMDSSPNEVDERLAFILQVGPLSQKVAGADAQTRQRVLDAVREAASPHLSEGIYRLPAAAWIVTARSE